MPVRLYRSSRNLGPLDCANNACGEVQTQLATPAARCVDIGLINNMPDGALKSTERQFLTLLDAASDGVLVRLWLYALPEVERSDWGRQHIAQYYSPIDSMWQRTLDGLIVTGAEPRTSSLTEESYWPSLTRVVDWAERNTRSTVWSCLAAHAAVLYTDGIHRRKLDEKRFGLFECLRVSDHTLNTGVPARPVTPHSRWNDLPVDALTSCGYSVLTLGDQAGVDAFVRQGNSLFVFFQGHPEYESNTLLLEYSRDVARYLRGENDGYPKIPCNYFNRGTVDALTLLGERAQKDPRNGLLAEIQGFLAQTNLGSPWRAVAGCVYRNWLTHLCVEQKQQTAESDSPDCFAYGSDLVTPRPLAASE